MQSDLNESLLRWYDVHRRELPWRVEQSLYRTVVSEFMLQQTQVKTMLPYFERWMRQFPDFPSLEAASETEVLKAWEGLGYYRRARHLHQCARIWCLADPKPTSYAAWLKYPGIGPYMAAAIASIEFDEPVVVVDGNVIRVIARLHGVDTAFRDAASAARTIRPLAQAILDPNRAGDSNQALMELGALVCKPDQPTCLLCPWTQACEARKIGNFPSIPNVRKATRVAVVRPRLLILDFRRKSILLSQDTMPGRLSGFWELPLATNNPMPHEASLGTIKRGIGNEVVQEPVYRARPEHLDEKQKAKSCWISLSKIPEISLSGPHRRWLTDFLSSDEGSC
jgi:A/G-specific adenine glycosylase